MNDTLAVEEEMSLIMAAFKHRDNKYVLKPHEEYLPDSNPTDMMDVMKRKREEEWKEDRWDLSDLPVVQLSCS